MELKFVKLSENAIVPCYGRFGDAGLDLFTAKEIVLEPGETRVIPTDIAIQLPLGYEAQVRPRSGISLKGVDCMKMIEIYDPSKTFEENFYCKAYLRVQLGTVDSNYRGNIGIITYNQEDYPVCVPQGTKLAQLVVSPVINVELVEADKLDETERGEKGYGSSDK